MRRATLTRIKYVRTRIVYFCTVRLRYGFRVYKEFVNDGKKQYLVPTLVCVLFYARVEYKWLICTEITVAKIDCVPKLANIELCCTIDIFPDFSNRDKEIKKSFDRNTQNHRTIFLPFD